MCFLHGRCETPSSFCYSCLFIPHHMPVTHAHNFLQSAFILCQHTCLFYIPRSALAALFTADASYPCHVSYCFALFCEQANAKREVVLQFRPASNTNLSFWHTEYFDCYLLHAGFLLGLFFNTENGDDMFLQNTD
jgi:hypothetical protein